MRSSLLSRPCMGSAKCKLVAAQRTLTAQGPDVPLSRLTKVEFSPFSGSKA